MRGLIIQNYPSLPPIIRIQAQARHGTINTQTTVGILLGKGGDIRLIIIPKI